MFFSLIEKRRSIRKFLDKPVPEDLIEKLVEAALRSPSSRGINPWEFIVVTDRERLVQLSKAKEHGAAFLQQAPLGLVVCADTSKTDVWVEDTSIAGIFIQLAAEALGLGSCWIQIRERMYDKTKKADQYVAECLNLPPRMAVESIIAIGYAGEKKRPHARTSLQFEKISYNRYGEGK